MQKFRGRLGPIRLPLIKLSHIFDISSSGHINNKTYYSTFCKTETLPGGILILNSHKYTLTLEVNAMLLRLKGVLNMAFNVHVNLTS